MSRALTGRTPNRVTESGVRRSTEGASPGPRLIAMSRFRDTDHTTSPHISGPTHVAFPSNQRKSTRTPPSFPPLRTLAEFLLMRGRSLAWVVLPVLAACLTPQDIELYEEEEMINLPPVIDLLHVEPAQPVVCISGIPDEPAVEFRLENVRDPNGIDGQVLSVRWFVDYSLANADAPGGDLSNLIIRAEDIEPVEAGTDVYLPAVMSSSEVQRLLLPNATHTIEAVVSDGFDSSGVPRNRAVRDGFYATSHKWAVVYLQDRPCD